MATHPLPAPAPKWTTEVIKSERRQNGKCRTCKTARSQLVEIKVERTYRSDKIGVVDSRTTVTAADGTRAVAGFQCCGRSWGFRSVRGRRNDAVKCDARCTGATGHNCECACGGKNHGVSHAA